MKGAILVLLMILSLFFFSMVNNQKEVEIIPLIGKIGYEWEKGKNKLIFNMCSKYGKSSFELDGGKNTRFEMKKWMRTQDLVCGFQISYIDDRNPEVNVIPHKEVKIRPRKVSIITLDTLGQIKDTLYEGNEMVELGFVYPSPSDSKLFFTTKNLPIKVNNLLDLGNIPLTFNIYDINEKKILSQINDFAFGNSFQMRESPWSSDETKIVYGITSQQIKHLTPNGNWEIYEAKIEDIGLYIFNITNGENNRISNEGYGPVWSPNGKYIAYLKGKNALWLYNVEKETHEEYLTLQSYDNMGELRWSPDGEYLKIGFRREHPLLPNSTHSYLIRFKDKKWFRFKEEFPGHYTWKS